MQPMFWCDYGENIQMGSHVEINHNCVILDCAPVTFGDHVFIGPNCGFYTAGHPLDAVTRNAGLEYARPIHRGRQRVVRRERDRSAGGDHRLRGRRRGGSVVSRDVPPNTVAVGNPCRVVKEIFQGEAPQREA